MEETVDLAEEALEAARHEGYEMGVVDGADAAVRAAVSLVRDIERKLGGGGEIRLGEVQALRDAIAALA